MPLVLDGDVSRDVAEAPMKRLTRTPWTSTIARQVGNHGLGRVAQLDIEPRPALDVSGASGPVRPTSGIGARAFTCRFERRIRALFFGQIDDQVSERRLDDAVIGLRELCSPIPSSGAGSMSAGAMEDRAGER